MIAGHLFWYINFLRFSAYINLRHLDICLEERDNSCKALAMAMDTIT